MLTHSIPPGAIRVPVPDVTQQTDYSCGPSCLEAICKYYGVGKSEEWQYVRGLCMDHGVAPIHTRSPGSRDRTGSAYSHTRR